MTQPAITISWAGKPHTAYFYWEPAQNGGRTDPSWPEQFQLEDLVDASGKSIMASLDDAAKRRAEALIEAAVQAERDEAQIAEYEDRWDWEEAGW